MGHKIRNIASILFLISFSLNAQEKISSAQVDSLTYRYFLNGRWDSLIELGKYAVKDDIDFKYLRQRMGFAYYSEAKYGLAGKQFKKALGFDSYDLYSLGYLYLSFLYDGNDDAASVIAGKLSRESRENLSVSLFKPVESIEAEYNFKYAGTRLRSHPQYFHIGIGSRLGPRVSLYQMYSNYYQTITIRLPLSERLISDNQPEYYALIKYSLSPYLKLKTAYHYLNTSWAMYKGSAHLGYFGFLADYPRLKLGTGISIMDIDHDIVRQGGILAGFRSQGRAGFYITGEFVGIKKTDEDPRIIYDQKAGLKLGPKAWLEANAVFGNLSDFSEMSAMYIYNTVDPTSFRSGVSLSLFPGKHISLWFNFTYERKDFYENLIYHYNQFSYLGGIRWKI